MASAVARRERHRRSPPVRSNSPERNRRSPERRERSGREPERDVEKERDRRAGSDRGRHREREDARDASRGRHRSPDSSSGEEEHERGRNRERDSGRREVRDREAAGDESPHTKRLRRAHEERETETMPERESKRDRERDDDRRDGSRERRHERERERRHRSRSPERQREKHGSRDEARDSRGDSLPRSGGHDSLAIMNAATEDLEAKEKQKPSFELSGKLAEETNKVRGVALIFTEPPEARKPDIRWRLYVFKGGDVLNEPLYVHRQSCYLFGRERRVADIPTDHPSCSKQHAVLQYRQVEKEQPDGMMAKKVRPYLMDLESTNGTFINDNRLEPRRYYELFEKDTIKFGNSSREYVLLHENSAG
ncbi:hypothetical protein LUZ61_006109 [Rhynchospora tenuis]|uniref:FHA domain-containing protein n=1 Tax=Rhynchospora tenuis TaxID=198213 RepID=A0AAD5ZR68_9POAL|nr:hypothetical protein LUZ61_006109 [Rhynchospora tenuis]